MLIANFTDSAMEIFINLLFLGGETGEELTNSLFDYFKVPSEVKEYAYLVEQYSLYGNCAELISGDPKRLICLRKKQHIICNVA